MSGPVRVVATICSCGPCVIADMAGRTGSTIGSDDEQVADIPVSPVWFVLLQDMRMHVV